MRWIVALAVMAAPARALDDAAVFAALTGKVLACDDGTAQRFQVDGETICFNKNGTQSIGHWRVQAGRYCSVWPPSDHWARYDVTRAVWTLGFVADDGGVLAENGFARTFDAPMISGYCEAGGIGQTCPLTAISIKQPSAAAC